MQGISRDCTDRKVNQLHFSFHYFLKLISRSFPTPLLGVFSRAATWRSDRDSSRTMHVPYFSKYLMLRVISKNFSPLSVGGILAHPFFLHAFVAFLHFWDICREMFPAGKECAESPQMWGQHHMLCSEIKKRKPYSRQWSRLLGAQYPLKHLAITSLKAAPL